MRREKGEGRREKGRLRVTIEVDVSGDEAWELEVFSRAFWHST